MLDTVYDSDNFKMLVTDLSYWGPIIYIEEVTNIMILSPASQNCHHHNVTNIAVDTRFTRQQNKKSTKTGLVDKNKKLMITVLF